MKRDIAQLPYREGTWFAVPLRTNGYGVGIVARLSGDGAVFGYFWGPKRMVIPTLEELSCLTPENCLWRAVFGDLGFLQREWPIIGEAAQWDRKVWPLPPFINVNRASGRSSKVTLSDDSLRAVTQEPCDPGLIRLYPEDAAHGYGAVEIKLTTILDHEAI
jgi:hypothetical protein